MFLGSVPFPFSLVVFPKQRLLSWLNTLTCTQVSSAVPIHTSWSKLGEFTLNGTAQLFIKELKAAEILVCIAMSVSDNQWESRTSSWWVGGGDFAKRHLGLSVSGLPTETPPSVGSAVVAQFSCVYQSLSGLLNPEYMDCTTGASFQSRAELPLVILWQSCAAAAPQLWWFMDGTGGCRPCIPCCQWAFFSAGAYGHLAWTGPLPVGTGSWRLGCGALSCLPGWASLHFGSCSAVKSLLHVRKQIG